VWSGQGSLTAWGSNLAFNADSALNKPRKMGTMRKGFSTVAS
jgi:hypothetical protein